MRITSDCIAESQNCLKENTLTLLSNLIFNVFACIKAMNAERQIPINIKLKLAALLHASLRLNEYSRLKEARTFEEGSSYQITGNSFRFHAVKVSLSLHISVYDIKVRRKE